MEPPVRVVFLGPPADEPRESFPWTLLIFGGFVLATVVAYRQGLFTSATPGKSPDSEAAAAMPVPDKNNESRPSREKTPAPSRETVRPAAELPEPEGPPVRAASAMGEQAALGVLAVQVDDFWLEPSTPERKSVCAALSATLANASNEMLVLPAVKVVLIDEAGRESTPLKQKDSARPALNPLFSAQNIWAFELPAGSSPFQARFTLKDDSAFVNLRERTAENQALVAAAAYAPVRDAAIAFANPRVERERRIDAARLDAGRTAFELEAVEKQADILNRKVKGAAEFLARATAEHDKQAKILKDTKSYLQELERAPPTARRELRLYQTKLAQAKQNFLRAEKNEATAAKDQAEKQSALAKFQKDLKDVQAQLDKIKPRYVQQEKALEALENKK